MKNQGLKIADVAKSSRCSIKMASKVINKYETGFNWKYNKKASNKKTTHFINRPTGRRISERNPILSSSQIKNELIKSYNSSVYSTIIENYW